MESIRKWFCRPKRDDTSLLAQFFYADESLNSVACELDSFDGRQEPERCTSLVNQLRHCQDKVLTICNQIMDELIPECRANRDFRVKFPDEVMQENLAGQLWFGAECLAAGSSILNREAESSAMRPLAKALTKSLEIVRNLLREHALKGHLNLKAQNPLEPSTEKLIESLKIFDRLFADFELCYVGTMVPVKSTKEYEQQELVCVLFSETLQRALERGLLNQADVDNYEPALMFTIPRLAIVAGLLAPPGGPLCLNSVDNISEMFRPFRTLLLKIRELLWTLNDKELYMLEKLLCSIEEPSTTISQNSKTSNNHEVPNLEDIVSNFYTGYPNCKDFIADFYTVTKNNGHNMDEVANDALLILDHEKNRLDKRHLSRNIKKLKENSIMKSALNEQYQNNNLNSQRDSSSASPTETYENDQDYINPDISKVLGDPENIDIPQSQYFLNQVSQEVCTPDESIEAENSLQGIETKKLVSETNKTLSNYLMDNECQNENSEHTDSGICTVVSSENTSLYDKSPEGKKLFSNEDEHNCKPNDEEENTSYSCSNLNSPKHDSIKSESSCVCNLNKSAHTSFSGMSSTGHHKLNNITKNTKISDEQGIEKTEEVSYESVKTPVYNNGDSSFHINYSENWENLNSNIETSSPHKKNCPSTSKNYEKIGNQIEKMAQEKISLKKEHDEKQKRRNRRRHERKDNTYGEEFRRRINDRSKLQLPTSTESSRSNSTDRCLNPRLVNFGASLHPSHNTRQMPNFGTYSPHTSPRIQHFETRGNSSTTTRGNTSFHNKKLLDHRRSRSEHIHRMKKRDSMKKDKFHNKIDHFKKKNAKSGIDLINDGLGPRTNKSGIVTTDQNSYINLPRPSKVHKNKIQINVSSNLKNELGSSSSCSSCYESSSETSEFHSDCQDDEEIALALQAAEIANRNQIRAKFRSSEDLVHRLFVCIAGVADQLQTNFASDLRNILKCVFLMNSTQQTNEEEDSSTEPTSPTSESNVSVVENLERQDSGLENEEENVDQDPNEERDSPETEQGEECVEKAPVWIPDNDAPRCMACQSGFTVVRRRHHCRNCGKVFCGRCSSNSVPLPRFGHNKPVRVCNRCFLYQVTPFV